MLCYEFFQNFQLSDFDYTLPKELIAVYPLSKRDDSNLLVYDRNKTIIHAKFKELPEFIPKGSLLLRNISKVISARFFLQKPSGGKVEVLLLESLYPSTDPEATLQATQKCIWQALLRGRNLKKGTVLHLINPKGINTNFYAKIIEKNSHHFTIEFNWFPEDITFFDILNQIGHIPLPPYITRQDENIDKERYQTIYGNKLGSVASHTAGLHFTQEVLCKLKEKSVTFAEITLHIGLGTFKPIQTKNIYDHIMHKENFSISYIDLSKIFNFLKNRTEDNLIVAIGTTSVRTLESIFWYAQSLYHYHIAESSELIEIPQYIWKQMPKKLSPKESIELLLEYMEKSKIQNLSGSTGLYITPDYKINFFDALITNFHQPRSTLLLLVYAFVGKDWKTIYQSALENKYRFLSYGDSSLLFRTNNYE